MHLKKGKRFGLTYQQQLKIYATCLNYENETAEVQQRIISLCRKCGGEHYNALFEAVTTDKRNLDVAIRCNIDESWLARLIKRFYSNW